MNQDYNHCPYVILYPAESNRIIFRRDSHHHTWTYILKNYEDPVANPDLPIAPHHGRDSGRSYEFLDTPKPTLTFFGNARSQHPAYAAWRNRGLSHITNNQANCMVVDASQNPMVLYVTHENFAKRVNPSSFYRHTFKSWYVGLITEDLIQKVEIGNADFGLRR